LRCFCFSEAWNKQTIQFAASDLSSFVPCQVIGRGWVSGWVIFGGFVSFLFPEWPEFCGRTLSWPAEHCPGHRSRWNPVPTAAWSTSPPEAGRIYLSFFLQIHPPLAPELDNRDEV
uniref:Uncharacterized protein n=1 Tax=Otus sunia TaxID=257818 RepID=A0A8C8A4Q8_9STRI